MAAAADSEAVASSSADLPNNTSVTKNLIGNTARKLTKEEIERLKRVVWGRELKEDVFGRWSQGFVFSEDEPAALVQDGGGPCAVITPVQGFIVKHLLASCPEEVIADGAWRRHSAKPPTELLANALAEMLTMVAPSEGSVLLVTMEQPEVIPDSMNGHSSHSEDEAKPSSPSSSPPKKSRLSHEDFHASLRLTQSSTTSQLAESLALLGSSGALTSRFAVITFLYSLLMTKGLDRIMLEVEDPSEPLIDGQFGHGSQSLLNLQISGTAVSNVFDDERDLGGYKLKGLTRQAPLGFLSFLEHLRYCEVGWNLKNPQHPIWVLGSETHFTLAFSTEKRLIIKDSPVVAGRRAFKQFDPEGNGFIPADLLKDLLASLDLVSEPPEFVTIMKDKLDPEGLGIIVLNNFLQEFYGDFSVDAGSQVPKSFSIYHYNGLRKTVYPQVVFNHAVAKIDEPSILSTDATPIQLCLQTKWPTLEMNWDNHVAPSLN